ncbi:carbonic anhydrase [Salegentibacter sp. HM20]
MEKKTLYLVCPECHIEQTIRKEFGSDVYFLTALGSVFDISEFEYAEDVNQLINNATISEIVIVNDIHCTFIKNTVYEHENHGTDAEKKLIELKINNKDKFESLKAPQQQKFLAKLNIYRQAYELMDVAFIGNKIEEGTIQLSGLIFNRENSEFEKLDLKI